MGAATPVRPLDPHKRTRTYPAAWRTKPKTRKPRPNQTKRVDPRPSGGSLFAFGKELGEEPLPDEDHHGYARRVWGVEEISKAVPSGRVSPHKEITSLNSGSVIQLT
jgi:hypothetical protein